MSIGKKLFWALLLAASWHTFGSVLYGIFVENILPTRLRAVAAVVAIINTIIFILECRKYRKITKIFFTIGKTSSRQITNDKTHYFLFITNVFLRDSKDTNNITNKFLVLEGYISNVDAELTTLSSDNFLVYDQIGKQLLASPLNQTYNLPIRVSTGRYGVFTHSYILDKAIDYIEIEYIPDSTWKRPAAIWKLALDEVAQSLLDEKAQKSNRQKPMTTFYKADKHAKIFMKQNNKEYTLAITNVEFDREQDITTESERHIVIEGYVDNISYDSISLSGEHFILYDKNSNKLPICSTINTQFIVNKNNYIEFKYYYLLSGKSNAVEIEYFPILGYERPTAMWKVTIEAIQKSEENKRIVQAPDIDI